MTTTRPLYLVGNWKMNFAPAAAAQYAQQLRREEPLPTGGHTWVAPPMVSLGAVSEALAGSPIKVGAQNVHWASAGAFTGETSPLFLTAMGATFTIVGHSERRTHGHEGDEEVARRCIAALLAGLQVILCVGESEEQRISGSTEGVLKRQLEPVLHSLESAGASRLLIAYEPVWAIGTGKVATPAEIAAAHHFIRSLWGECAGVRESAVDARILYGGSVTPNNFAEILNTPGVDGALVGGASIKREQWQELLRIARAALVARRG